jgi:hypothetical protein
LVAGGWWFAVVPLTHKLSVKEGGDKALSDRRTRRAELIIAVGLPSVAVVIYLIAFVVRWCVVCENSYQLPPTSYRLPAS